MDQSEKSSLLEGWLRSQSRTLTDDTSSTRHCSEVSSASSQGQIGHFTGFKADRQIPVSHLPCKNTAEPSSNEESTIIPALSNDDSSAESSSLVKTSLAIPLGGMKLLNEDEEGALVVGSDDSGAAAAHQCVFHFLNCDLSFEDADSWRTHVMSHFRGHSPPNEVHCFLCSCQMTAPHGQDAWNTMLTHILHVHSGHNMATSRPDPSLLKYLWNRHIINDMEYDSVRRMQGDQTRRPSLDLYKIHADERRDRRRYYRNSVKRTPGTRESEIVEIIPASSTRKSTSLQNVSYDIDDHSTVTSASSYFRDITLGSSYRRDTSTAGTSLALDNIASASVDRFIKKELPSSRRGSRSRLPSESGNTVDFLDQNLLARRRRPIPVVIHQQPLSSPKQTAKPSLKEISEGSNVEKSDASSLHSHDTSSESLVETSSLDTPQGVRTGSLLDGPSSQLVSEFMDEFYRSYNHFLTGGKRTCTGQPESSTGSREPRPSLPNKGTSSSKTETRDAISRRNPPSSNEDENGDGEDPKERSKAPPQQDDRSKLACPFHKHNSTKYTCNRVTGSKYRACAGPGWTSISRLKEHIYRRHLAPRQCRRCWSCFDSDNELDDHINEDVRCEKKPFQRADGVAGAQVERLKSKKRTCADQSDSTKWREMYTIIFPDDPVPLTPYYDWDILEKEKSLRGDRSTAIELECLEDFKDYTFLYLPVTVLSELEKSAQNKRLTGDEIRDSLGDIVYSSLATVYEEWERKRRRHLPNETTNLGSSAQHRSSTAIPFHWLDNQTQHPDIEIASLFAESSSTGSDTLNPKLNEPPISDSLQYHVEPAVGSTPQFSHQPPPRVSFGNYDKQFSQDLSIQESWPQIQNSEPSFINFDDANFFINPSELQCTVPGLSDPTDVINFVPSNEKGKNRMGSSLPVEIDAVQVYEPWNGV